MGSFLNDFLLFHISAMMLASLLWIWLNRSGFTHPLPLAVIVMLLIETMVYRLAQSSRLRTAQVENEINRLNTLPLDEVRRRLKGFLDKYRRKTPTKGPLHGMASSQQEFFALYDTVVLGEGTVLGFQEFKPSKWQPDFFVIGGDGTKEVVAKNGDDRVWEIEGPISEKSLSMESYPSIWHYVLVCARFAGDVADA